jgi:uncharacterized protein
MQWDQLRRSENVEDARGGGFGGMAVGAGELGIGGLILITLLGWAFGIDPSVSLACSMDKRQPAMSGPAPQVLGHLRDHIGQFVAAVLGDTEDRWTEIFQQTNRVYRPPKLLLFSGADQSVAPAIYPRKGGSQFFAVLNIEQSVLPSVPNPHPGLYLGDV